MKILESFWFSGEFGCIGIVVGEDTLTKERKAYIHTCSGVSEEGDSNHILETGSPVMEYQVSRIAELLKEAKR